MVLDYAMGGGTQADRSIGNIPMSPSVATAKAALASDYPLLPVVGAVRPIGASALVGNSHWGRWSGKYHRDKWGRYVLTETGDRVLSPGYDPEQPYVPRQDRPKEWTIVGLLGQVPVLKSARKPSNWLLVWEIDAVTEMWLVR